MSNNSISPISNVSLPVVSAALPKSQAKIPVETASEQDKSPKKAENETEQANSSTNVSVHFRVNNETNELTVFVIDRSSHRVLRSIPISELQKMPSGELVKLAA
jgi:uncharacterized FlaG/YvyC family protein